MTAKKLLAPLMLVAGLGAALAFQPVAARRHESARAKSEVYLLPPPKQLAAMTMGYRSATADILWAHVLVAQGLRSVEKRRFQTLLPLLDAINELDPTFRRPYLLADALVTFQAADTPFEEVEKAREIMVRGTKNRPNDAEIWLRLGQFVAFIVPAAYIRDNDELRSQWRREGAEYLAHAASLGGDEHVGWGALGGAGILSRAGEREATIALLKRILVIADDEELKASVQMQLQALMSEEDVAAYEAQRARVDQIWASAYPGSTRNVLLILGPRGAPLQCAGETGYLVPGADPAKAETCARSWKSWAASRDR